MRVLHSLLILLCINGLFAQFPNTGLKIRLGYQTTGDGLVWRGSLTDTSTLDPSSLDNSWMLLDTASGSLYAYRSKAWQLVSGGGGGGGGITGSGAANRAAFWTGASALSYDNNFTWDNTNKRLGIGTTTPTRPFQIVDTSSGIPIQFNVQTTKAKSRSQLGLQNDLNYFVEMQMSGSNYASLPAISNVASFSCSGSGVQRLSFVTNGETNTGGTTPITFIAGGYDNAAGITIRPGNPGEVSVGGVADYGAYNLQCNGTGVWGAGAYVNGSDARIKENINDIGSSLNTVMKLKPVTFKYIESFSKDRAVQTGFIAQDLLSALEGKDYINGIVNQGGEYLSVAYQNLIPLLTKAMQEQQAQIEALKKEIEALKNK